jgi:hypothetical protein
LPPWQETMLENRYMLRSSEAFNSPCIHNVIQSKSAKNGMSLPI